MVIQVKVTMVATIDMDERFFPGSKPYEIVSEYTRRVKPRMSDPKEIGILIKDLDGDVLEVDIQCIDPTPFVGHGAKGAGNDR